MLEEALGGILCIYDLWAHMSKGVGRYQWGGIRCEHGEAEKPLLQKKIIYNNLFEIEDAL